MEYKKIEINTDEADKFGILIENLLRHCTKKVIMLEDRIVNLEVDNEARGVDEEQRK